MNCNISLCLGFQPTKKIFPQRSSSGGGRDHSTTCGHSTQLCVHQVAETIMEALPCSVVINLPHLKNRQEKVVGSHLTLTSFSVVFYIFQQWNQTGSSAFFLLLAGKTVFTIRHVFCFFSHWEFEPSFVFYKNLETCLFLPAFYFLIYR